MIDNKMGQRLSFYSTGRVLQNSELYIGPAKYICIRSAEKVSNNAQVIMLKCFL